MINKEIFSVNEAANYLSVSRAYVYLLVRFGVLKPFRRNPILLTKDELDNFKKQKEIKNGTTTEERA